jgi:hypothetical protein
MNRNLQASLVNSTVYVTIALKCAFLVALAQAPLFFFRITEPRVVVYFGWALILGYTLYRVWELNVRSLVVNDVAVVQLVGCIGCIALSAAILYVTTIALDNQDSSAPIWLIKAVFITNPFVALNVASFAMVGTSITSRVGSLSDRLKR